MLNSTAALRELVLAYRQQLLGLDPSGETPPVDERAEVRELAQQWLNQLLGMDIDVS